ncbi:serine/threonine-protein kinase [Streptomyces anulatus]|uniref:serine/threonine-protein kinase n=1 Tax=Streptomyces anulatus TaxID=1892 RepID=UPI00365C7B2A
MTGRFAALADDDPDAVGGYVLRARIGVGGMGRVYLAFTPGGRPLAVKVVRPDYAHDPEFRRRFKREIKAARSVEGLYTAPVVDADGEASLPWLATAYVPGPSLAQAVAEHGPFPLSTVFRLIAGVAEGLTAVHACGLVHRDLKPANVLLADDGPRVIDFGIAHAASATSATTTGLRIGTPAYMAPEQVRGRSAGPPADVFALGNLAVYAATGRAAFGEGNPEALFYRILHEAPELDSCPKPLRGLARRCLAKEPAERPTLDRILTYAARHADRDTSELAGGWLPDALVTALPAYGTAKYQQRGKRGKREKHSATAHTEKRTEPRATKRLPDGKPSPKPLTAPAPAPAPSTRAKPSPEPAATPPPNSGSDHAWIGYLAAAAVVVVLAIGPAKAVDWLESQLVENPPASAAAGPTTPPTSGSPTGPDGLGSPSPPQPTPDTRTTGCLAAEAALRDHNGRKPSAPSGWFTVEFDMERAAGETDDPDLSAAIDDVADDLRDIRNNMIAIREATDEWRMDQLQEEGDRLSARFGRNWDRVTDLCY